MAADLQLSTAAVASEECLPTRVAATNVQERVGAAFIASLDPVKRAGPPNDEYDGAASVSGSAAPSPSVACNGHQSSDPFVRTHVPNEVNRTVDQVDALPSIKVVRHVTSSSTVEAAAPEAGCDDDAAKVCSVPSDLVDRSRADQAATNSGAAAVRPLSAEAALQHESDARVPGGKRLFDSFVDVLSVDDVTVLKWPRDMVCHTVAQPSVAYSCNPLLFDFRASRASGAVPSVAAADREGVVGQLVDELVTVVCGEDGTDCIAGAADTAASVGPCGPGRSVAGIASYDELLVAGRASPSATGGECERQPFAAKLGSRITARRQYRWKNRGKRTSGQTSAADGVQKNVRASTAAAAPAAAAAAAVLGEEQPLGGGEAVQKDKRKLKKKKRKKKKKDRRHKRSRSSPKNASSAAAAADEEKSQMSGDSGLRGVRRRLDKREKAGTSSCTMPGGDTKICASGSAVHEVKRKSRKHKSKRKHNGKQPPALCTGGGDNPDGEDTSGEQARDATPDPETVASEDKKAGTQLPSPAAVCYGGANGCGDSADVHAAAMPAVEMDSKPCASDLNTKERKPRGKSVLSCAPAAGMHTTLATEQGDLSASSPPTAVSTVVVATAALPVVSSTANAPTTQAAFPDTGTVATFCTSLPTAVSACRQGPGESVQSSGRPQSSDQSPLRKRSAGAPVTSTVVCEGVTAAQSPTVSDRGPPKKIKIAFKAAPRGSRGGTTVVEPFVVSKWDSSDGESESESERRRLRLQTVLRLADPGGSNGATTLSESVAIGAASAQPRSASLPESGPVITELACHTPSDNGGANKPGSCHSVAPAASCIVRSPASTAALVADTCNGTSASRTPASTDCVTSKADRDSAVGCRGLAGPGDRVPGRDESRHSAGEGAASRSRSRSRSVSRSRSRQRRGASSAARSSNVSRSSVSSTDSRSPGRRSGYRHRRRRSSRSYSRSVGSSSSSRERSRTSSCRSRSTRSASSDASGSRRRRRRHRRRRRTRSSSTERSLSRRGSSRSRSRSRGRSCSSRSRSRSRSWSRRHRHRRRHRRHRSSSSRYSRSHSHSRTATRSRSRSRRRRSRSIRRLPGRRLSSGRTVSAAFAATKKSQLLPAATRQPALVRGLVRPGAVNKKPAALPAQLNKPPVFSAMAASSHQLQRQSQEGAQHVADSGNSTEQQRSPGTGTAASNLMPSAQQGSVVGHTGTAVSLQLSNEQRVVSMSSAEGRALGLGADEVADSQTGTSLSMQGTAGSMAGTGLSGPAAAAAAPLFIGPLRPGERQDAPVGEGYDIPLPAEQQPTTVSQGGSGERARPSSSGTIADAVVQEPVAESQVMPYDATPSEPVPMQLPPEQAEQYRGLQEQAELYRELREQQQRMREALAAQGRTAVVAVGDDDDLSHHADQLLPPPHEAVVQSYAQQMIMAQHKPSFSLPPMAAASPPLPVPLLSPAVAMHQQAAKAAAAAAAAVHALPAAGGIPLQAGSPVLLAGPSPAAAAAAAAFHAQVAALQQQQQQHHQQQQQLQQQQQQQQQLAAHIQAQMQHMQAAANAAAVGGLPLHLSGHHPGFAQPAALSSGLLHGLGVQQLHGLHIGGLGAGPGSAAALAMSAGGLPQLVGPAHPVLAPNAQQLMHIGPQLVHLPFGAAMAAAGGGGGGSGPAVVMIQGAPHVLLPSRLHRGL